MNSHEAPRTESDVAGWLAQGPERAPTGLLASTLERTRASKQRPALLALAHGARLAGAPVRSSAALRLAVIVGLLALLAVVIALIGSQRHDPIVVVAPSTSPVPVRPSARPSAPPAKPVSKCMFSAELPCTASVQNVVDTSLRFYFAGGTRWSNLPWTTGTSRSFGYGKCWDGICQGGYIRVSAFPIDEGFTVPGEGNEDESPATHVAGTTLAKLERAWLKAFPKSTAAETEVDGVPAIVLTTPARMYVLAINDGRIYGFTSSGPAFIPNYPSTTLEGDAVLRTFLGNFRFMAPASGRVGDLEVKTPDGWTLTVRPSSLVFAMGIWPGTPLAYIQEVSVVEPGSELEILRTGSGNGSPFSIGGATFAELVDSIDQGLNDASRSDAEIDGAPGFRWTVPQQLVAGPLAMMAALEWRDRFYVFQVHYPLDGAPNDMLGPLLDEVTLH